METMFALNISLMADVYTNPNYVPSILANSCQVSESNAALLRFECADNCAKLKIERARQEERNTLEPRRVDEERKMIIHSAVFAFINDHTYTQKSFMEETLKETLTEQMLECVRVEHPDAENFMVLQLTLSQSEHPITEDCCIPRYNSSLNLLRPQLILINYQNATA